MKATLSTYVSTEEILFEINGFTAQLCCSAESLRQAYALRYVAYLNSGSILEKSDQLFFDEYDQQVNTRIHLIWYEGIPVASVRSCIWSKKYDYSPVESITNFPKAIVRRIGLEKNILESSRYVITPGFNRRKSLFAQLLLFKIQDLSSCFDNCPYIITSVRERHAAFYQRMLAFEQISEPIQHDFIDAKIVLLKTSQKESREIITSKGMPTATPEEIKKYSELAKLIYAST